jgi:hypothetical protein
MTIPTSLWENTRHEEMQIFSALDAITVLEMMTMAFDPNRANTIH